MAGGAAGGGYDQSARTLARHLERHLPGNPNVAVENMTGAAGMRATNWLYNVAPRDGLTIGITQRSVLVEPLLGTKDARFDPTRFSWLASLNDEAFIAVTRKDRGIDSVSDAQMKVFAVAADGPVSDDHVWPAVLNAAVGAKFKIISGYTYKAEKRLSVRRGETGVLIGWSRAALQTQAWDDFKAGNWRLIAHLGKGKHPAFLAKAQKQKLDISPAPGEELAARVDRLVGGRRKDPGGPQTRHGPWRWRAGYALIKFCSPA